MSQSQANQTDVQADPKPDDSSTNTLGNPRCAIKLSYSNYHMWSKLAQGLLQSYPNAWGVVSGTITKPTDPTTDEGKKKLALFENGTFIDLRMFLNSVEPEIISNLIGLGDGKMIWYKL